jgi:hypothetical protein
MRRLVAGVLVVALLLAGAAPGLVSGNAGTASAPAADASATAPPDPESDVVGWEAGYWYNESIDVDQSDGLSDAELEAYVARAMARVEHLREKEFQSEVPVSVQSRESFRNRSPTGGNGTNASYDAWNDQVWESLSSSARTPTPTPSSANFTARRCRASTLRPETRSSSSPRTGSGPSTTRP